MYRLEWNLRIYRVGDRAALNILLRTAWHLRACVHNVQQ